MSWFSWTSCFAFSFPVRTLPIALRRVAFSALGCVIAFNNNLLCRGNQVSNYCRFGSIKRHLSTRQPPQPIQVTTASAVSIIINSIPFPDRLARFVLKNKRSVRSTRRRKPIVFFFYKEILINFGRQLTGNFLSLKGSPYKKKLFVVCIVSYFRNNSVNTSSDFSDFFF